ncbi:hypothetical protein SEUCBS139899_006308 [Sporothrix eucalyptigena]|uniref:Uncharacterized protein n=1 Tax=Sporothrix eucalyptigena TaxID=1812306 RepID=A0ABP0CTI3_9PEZI
MIQPRKKATPHLLNQRSNLHHRLLQQKIRREGVAANLDSAERHRQKLRRAQEADRKRRREEDDKREAKRRDDAVRRQAATQAAVQTNPFHQAGLRYPALRQWSTRTTGVLSDRWSRWTPVVRGGPANRGNGAQNQPRRHKCSCCNWGWAIVRQRILVDSNYEMIDLCYSCKLKCQRGLLVLDDRQWDLVDGSDSGSDALGTNKPTSSEDNMDVDNDEPAVAAPTPKQQQQGRICGVARSVSNDFYGLARAIDPVTHLENAASFVSGNLWRPVATLVAATALDAREIRKGPRRINDRELQPTMTSSPANRASPSGPARSPIAAPVRAARPAVRQPAAQNQQIRAGNAGPQFRRYTPNDPRLFFGYLS